MRIASRRRSTRSTPDEYPPFMRGTGGGDAAVHRRQPLMMLIPSLIFPGLGLPEAGPEAVS